MSGQPTVLVLRNYPDDDALDHPEKYSKALSFSPDIIPHYGMQTDQSTLVNPAAWRGFTGMPIIGGEVNNVYIRGHGSGGPYIVSLRVLPSELILWPQAWYDEDPVASGPVMIQGADKPGPCVADGPLQFRPSHTTGNTYSLVANVVKHLPNMELPPPPFDPKHVDVDEFISFLSKDKTFTFYNVVVADPTLKHVSVTTRLRMFSKLPVKVTFCIIWHSGPSAPKDLQVSLVDDLGAVNVRRTLLSSFGKVEAILDPSYDAILSLNVFSPAESSFFEPYSGFSLQVFKSNPSSTGSDQLLGALNVVFEPHSTRNLRFASPAATQLREQTNAPAKGKVDSSKGGGYGPIPETKPAATGWWTRTVVADTNHFPHHGPFGYSPDIQPIGTNPNVKGILSTLQNPSLDYANAHTVELVGNDSNYIFVRGHSTLAGIDVQSRLFAVGANTVNHPSQYLKGSLVGKVFDGTGMNNVVNNQTISAENANKFYLFDKPFVIESPPKDSTRHYCLIAEFRQKRQNYPVFPGWPSAHWHNYATLADFQVYLFSNHLVCWRNINWEPCQPGGNNCWSWPCSINLDIPDCSFYSSFWTIIVECDSSIIPANSMWSLTCDDNELFPDGICFTNQGIGTKPPAFTGCHFTGARPGYSAKLTLTVTWCDHRNPKIPPPSVKFTLAMTETPTTPISHLAQDPVAGSDAWPLYVTDKYPYIGTEPNPSPLPSFKSAGPNKWPFPGASQFNIGQVAMTGKHQ